MEWNRHVGTELGPTLRAWRSVVLDLPSFFQQPLLFSPSHWDKPQLLAERAHTPSSPLLPSFPGHRVWSSWWFLQTLVTLVPRDLCLIHVVMWSAPIGQNFLKFYQAYQITILHNNNSTPGSWMRKRDGLSYHAFWYNLFSHSFQNWTRLPLSCK